MGRLSSFMAGILSGAIVGGVTALLLAPMAGDELIEEARERADQLIANVRATVDAERKRLEEELASLKRGEIEVT